VTPQDSALAGPPVITAVSAGKASVALTWSPPRYAGTSKITGYTVEAYTAGATSPTVTMSVGRAATSAKVTGLTGGTPYTFDVIAVNAAGPGSPSVRSVPVVPIGAPDAPALTSVSPGNASATLTWVPAPDNGSPITEYRVSVYNGSATNSTRTVRVDAAQFSVTITKLTNGAPYTFDVRAVNSAGVGLASARSGVIQPAGTRPGPPQIGTVKAGAAGGQLTVKVAWSKPSDNGGSAITGYSVTARRVDTNGAVLGTTVSHVNDGSTHSVELVLPAGSYNFTVQATNAYGTSDPSQTSATVAAR
jgi:hypothetical protein